uniref:uncharacterized protein LOC122589796 n=1 Tax=Erigeron canadensis TaxID=72917 RepID=UPI001CB939A6|nr:uncharacterized protein LOC122589796 [Erigeron canadensis]
MQTLSETNDISYSPSFSFYSLTSATADRVSHEIKQEQYDEFDHDFNNYVEEEQEDDFEFSLRFGGEEFSKKELALAGRILLPIFDTDLVTKDELDNHVVKDLDHNKYNNPSTDIIPIDEMLTHDTDESLYSSSSSETDDLEDKVRGTFCVSWRKPAEMRSSPKYNHIRKSKSTGSEPKNVSRKWKVSDILRRSNSDGKETLFFLCPKSVEASNKKRFAKSSEGPKVAKTGSSPSVHELFYVHKRAEHKGDKMKSYLPYRKDILGFRVYVNGDGNKKLPF